MLSFIDAKRCFNQQKDNINEAPLSFISKKKQLQFFAKAPLARCLLLRTTTLIFNVKN